jgi:hypothetical protein
MKGFRCLPAATKDIRPDITLQRTPHILGCRDRGEELLQLLALRSAHRLPAAEEQSIACRGHRHASLHLPGKMAFRPRVIPFLQEGLLSAACFAPTDAMAHSGVGGRHRLAPCDPGLSPTAALLSDLRRSDRACGICRSEGAHHPAAASTHWAGLHRVSVRCRSFMALTASRCGGAVPTSGCCTIPTRAATYASEEYQRMLDAHGNR